jgi:hypothetical protein
VRVGLIAEGPADLAVLSNLVRGVLGIEGEDVRFLRPELTRDETDLHAPGAETFSNWEIVKQECQSRARIDEFLDSPVFFEGEDDRRYVVVHLDSAECHLYEVARPPTAAELLERVRETMAEWLGGDCASILRAVAVEETDAWLLALHEGGDSTKKRKAKEAWKRLVQKRDLQQSGTAFQQYDAGSKPLRKKRERDKARKSNVSLDRFVAELESASAPPEP